MLLALAGVPRKHFDRIQKLAGTIAGTGHRLVAVPSFGDDGVVRRQDAERVAKAIVSTALRSKDPGEQGVGVMYLAHSWSNADDFESYLYPSAPVLKVELPEGQIVTDGRAGAIYLNTVVQSLHRSKVSLIKAVSSATTEMRSRKNRTPLLLPLSNFKSPALDGALRNAFRAITSAPHPTQVITDACETIELTHPFRSKGDGRGFTDVDDVVFRSPGRDLHGNLWDGDAAGHTDRCKLNGLFRLGGPIITGFHYDCMRGNRLVGDFHDCHGGMERRQGKPHLNIAPNDFVR